MNSSFGSVPRRPNLSTQVKRGYLIMDSRRGTYDQRPPKRLEDPPKCLPVLFVICVIITLYLIYVFWHCVPLLQLEKAQHLRDDEMVMRGMWHLIVFVFLSTLLDICYVRSIYTDPGEIPESYRCEGDPAQEQPPSGVSFQTKLALTRISPSTLTNR